MPNAHPERIVLVEGHTDNVGLEAYNQNLNELRSCCRVWSDIIARTLQVPKTVKLRLT